MRQGAPAVLDVLIVTFNADLLVPLYFLIKPVRTLHATLNDSKVSRPFRARRPRASVNAPFIMALAVGSWQMPFADRLWRDKTSHWPDPSGEVK